MAILARSQSRDGYAVRVLAVHTTEGSGTAESLRDAAWWEGSSHALADERGKLLTPTDGCVPYDRAAWTLRSGNRWSENIELVGFAKWKRGDWLARPKLLDACARWLAARSVARGIPLVKLSPKEYAAGRSGVIGHVDHTIGYSDGTHWDPGPDFPYDVVLPKAAEYAGGKAKTTTSEEDDMYDQDARNELVGRIDNGFASMVNYFNGLHNDDSRTRIGLIQYGIDLLLSHLDTEQLDYDKLASALAPVIAPMVDKAGTGATAQEIVDLLADRLKPSA